MSNRSIYNDFSLNAGALPDYLEKRAYKNASKEIMNKMIMPYFDARGVQVNPYAQMEGALATTLGIDKYTVPGARSTYPVDWNYALDNFGKKPQDMAPLRGNGPSS